MDYVISHIKQPPSHPMWPYPRLVEMDYFKRQNNPLIEIDFHS